MIFAVILAGGTGTRMKSSTIPKQFMKLGNTTVLQHTIDKFLYYPDIDHIFVAIHSTWLQHAQDILCDDRYHKISFCEGGETRQESLYKTLLFIRSQFLNSDDAIIISHDVARPFVSIRIIEENIKLAKEFDAVDTVISASDTIVESLDGKTILSIPNRKNMYMGQTPQSFRLGRFIEIYERLVDDYIKDVTDAARILIDNNCTVAIAQGDIFNIKITDDFDLNLANFLLGLTND